MLPSGGMEKQFNEEAYAAMDAHGGKQWCEAHLETFVAHLVGQFEENEMTQGNIRKAAEQFIFDKVDDADFADLRQRIEAENPAMVGIYIKIMAEYMLELVIHRG